MAGPSDDEIEAMTIGGAVVHDAPIRLAEYDPSWPVLFSRKAARIRAALGSVAIKVEHVGSTSVPGLAAKPVIDIVLTVPDSSDEAAFVPALEAAGYVLRIREPAWFEHQLFKGPEANVQVHVFTDGPPEVERMERFRDHLRVDQDDRDLRTHETRTRGAELDLGAALREREVRRRAGDYVAGVASAIANELGAAALDPQLLPWRGCADVSVDVPSPT